MRHRGQAGQAAFEYVVAGALVAALLALPMSGGRSTLDLLLDGVQRGYARIVAALAVPA